MCNGQRESLEDKWERYKCDLERWKVDVQCHIASYEQVNAQGQAAMKAALLINGGASVAMLAFLGTTMKNGADKVLLSQLCASMAMFTLGVLCAAVSVGVTYLTGLQDNSDSAGEINSKKKIRWALILNCVAIFLVLFAYAFFIAGSWNAYNAFTISLTRHINLT